MKLACFCAVFLLFFFGIVKSQDFSASDLLALLDANKNNALSRSELKKCGEQDTEGLCARKCLCNAILKDIGGAKRRIRLRDLETYLETAPLENLKRPLTCPFNLTPTEIVQCFDLNNNKGISKRELKRCTQMNCDGLTHVCQTLRRKFKRIRGSDMELQKEEIAEVPSSSLAVTECNEE